MAKLGSFGNSTDDAKSKPQQETIKAQKNGATNLDATVETFAYPELEQERELYAKWQDQYEQETVDTQPTDQEIIAATSSGQSVTDNDVERLRNIMGTDQNDWFGVPDLGLSPEFAIDRNLFGDINGYLTSNQAGFNAAINSLPSSNLFAKVITGGIYDIARGTSGFFETLSNDFWGTSKQIVSGVGSLVGDLLGAKNGDALAAYRLYERGSNAFDGAVSDFSSFIDNFGKGRYSESGADISGYLSVPTGVGLIGIGTKSLLGKLDNYSASNTLSYQASSGISLQTKPEVTTTILGSYAMDMASVIEELGNIKSMDFGAKLGRFNVLNAPDELFSVLGPQGFWDEVNVPFLNSSIARNDNILMATTPSFDNSFKGQSVRATA